MPFTLLGAVVLGLAVAGVLMLAARLFKLNVPRWTLPTAAGLAVIAYIVWSDYTWFRRTAGVLPPGIEVAAGYGTSSTIRPWTLVKAPVERFVAVDANGVRTNPKAPGYALAVVYFLQRYLPTAQATQLYDCTAPRRADLGASVELRDDGLPPDDAWVKVAPDDAVRRTVCAAAEG